MLDQLNLSKSPEEWDNIHKKMLASDWENFTLNRQNELSSWLSLYHKTEYQDNWNPVVRKHRPIVNEYVSALVKTQQINEDLSYFIRWDLIHLYIEQYFNKISGAPLFYLPYALPLYLKNKIPCAWSGIYPDGCIEYV